ncbi:hypothetical protein GCM10027275_40710 [Rhabdobacter roseus]|uniref:LysM repeat protein n=1 Tax=Rhabdobacter roseus TaxID=1655419 RepID=A0A840TT27_9BACT|nr:LysM peptidoglycan-binding domain-containing protein [Rhabdobacter roseus]MBB5286045.1 LysM repeat protein [Rhabdobacter roseus]
MEDEIPKKRNIRPTETSNLPLITLTVLVLLVLGMLYVGYEYIADDTSGAEELTSIVPDTSSNIVLFESEANPILAEPEMIDSGEVSDLPETTLPLPPPVETPAVETPRAEAPKPEPAKPEPAKPEPKKADVGGTSYTHTVQAGETLFGIANRYNLKPETLKALNPNIKDFSTDLKSGVTKLNVRVQSVHTVGPGDVLRVVASKYGISKELLMQANGKSRDFAQRGEKLVIPFPEKK